MILLMVFHLSCSERPAEELGTDCQSFTVE